MIRKFTMTNALNETIDLNDGNLFAYDPEGLGLAMNNEFVAANANFLQTAANPAQGQFSVRMLFLDDSYKTFHDFAVFLANPPYVLTYETDAGKFNRDCALAEATKTEIGAWGVIDEEVTFDLLTPWYRVIDVTSNAGRGVFEPGAFGKTYILDSGAPPENNNVIYDPTLSSMSAVAISPAPHLPFFSLTDLDSPEHGHNVLVYSGLGAPIGSVTLEFQAPSLGVPRMLEFWYKVDTPDTMNGEFNPTQYTNEKPRIFFDGIDVTQYIGPYTGVFFLPPFATAGWHKVRMLFTAGSAPRAARIFPQNKAGRSYFSAPKFYTVQFQSGGTPVGYAYNSTGTYIYGEYTANELQQSGVFNINNRSQYTAGGSPAIIRVYNAAIDPSWELVVGGEVVQSDGFFVNVSQGQVLEVSSFPQSQSAQLVEATGGSTNIYQYRDLTKTNFITFPAGASTLIFEGVTGQIEIIYREEYLLV